MTLSPHHSGPVAQALTALGTTQPALADAFGAGWDTTAGAWAAGQWEPLPGAYFEPAFRAALVAELAGGEGGAVAADQLVATVERTGAVLTPHHVCPTPGPTFGAIDQLSCLGHDGPVLVLAWSGVPMSNSAASGALCFSDAPLDALLTPGPELKRQRQAAKDRARDGVTEQRLTLVPGSMRDALLYRAPVPDRLHDIFAAATPELASLIPAPAASETYPAWAVRAAQAVERAALGRSDLWYVDLNEVARRYLIAVLDEPDHPVSQFLRAGVEVPGSTWFYGRRPGKREKVAPYDHVPDDLRDQLQRGDLCPGLVPVFGALRMLSRVRLLGGFRQIGYLESIADAWRSAGLPGDEGVPGRLMTGRLVHEGRPVYPLDLALGAVDRAVLPGADTPMSELWAPLLPRVQQIA